MNKRSESSGGVYFVPTIWHGPAGEVPERYRREGIPAHQLGIDPLKVQPFKVYTVPEKSSE